MSQIISVVGRDQHGHRQQFVTPVASVSDYTFKLYEDGWRFMVARLVGDHGALGVVAEITPTDTGERGWWAA